MEQVVYVAVTDDAVKLNAAGGIAACALATAPEDLVEYCDRKVRYELGEQLVELLRTSPGQPFCVCWTERDDFCAYMDVRRFACVVKVTPLERVVDTHVTLETEPAR